MSATDKPATKDRAAEATGRPWGRCGERAVPERGHMGEEFCAWCGEMRPVDLQADLLAALKREHAVTHEEHPDIAAVEEIAVCPTCALLARAEGRERCD